MTQSDCSIYHFTQLNPTFDRHSASPFWETISGLYVWRALHIYDSFFSKSSLNIHLLVDDITALNFVRIAYDFVWINHFWSPVWVCVFVPVICLRMGKINRIILRHIYFSCCNVRPFAHKRHRQKRDEIKRFAHMHKNHKGRLIHVDPWMESVHSSRSGIQKPHSSVSVYTRARLCVRVWVCNVYVCESAWKR